MIQTINKNKYKITVDCGKVNGKRKRISRIFNGNKKDAKILESELKKRIMNNDTSFIKNKELTFNEVIDMFMKDRVRLAVGKKIVIEDPKTINSKRIVQISEFCIGLLKELKEEQKRQYKNLKKEFKENYFVFINEYGEPIYPDTISKRFKKILEKNNLKKITFHELRHTSATLLINSNIDINSVSKRLGHANVSTTLNIYTHVLEKTKQEMANKMNDILTN